ncbi:unnamed protein product [Sordaria macrospora k-hell]|uniref:WGS project CABT00000000 data, contig 2.1583 n=1 Tax=Sordaria macrospora (strain ATCC MYA-333 / DSM 997 / K(L3346) / K-hell) TaxID=771870 RepID=F7WD35_SORMK|nr:uncharacterized protein SMAC_12661 [Sordaria macrospora k-hell]CCC14782.1 unnamed protein product [Sordaria macrospora k-hell]
MDVINKHVIMSVRWNVNIIRKLVGISEAIRLILVLVKLRIINLTIVTFILSRYTYFMTFSILSNIIGMLPPLTKCLIKEGRNIHTKTESGDPTTKLWGPNSDRGRSQFNKYLPFRQWLAGLIDGDGYFLLTKKGYSSCEITMDARDAKALYEIKHKYGGNIKPISNASAVRYKLRHKKGLMKLINDVNGLLRNPTRLLQMNKLCVKYDIELKYPGPLTFNDGWLSGFIDSDGSIYYNERSGQVFISLTQKNRYLLEPLIAIYGGRVDIHSPKIEAFKYIIYRKGELLNLIDNYFTKYPLKTEKMKRVNLIKDFYLLRIHAKSQDINKFNEWVKFKDRWEKYQD